MIRKNFVIYLTSQWNITGLGGTGAEKKIG